MPYSLEDIRKSSVYQQADDPTRAGIEQAHSAGLAPQPASAPALQPRRTQFASDVGVDVGAGLPSESAFERINPLQPRQVAAQPGLQPSPVAPMAQQPDPQEVQPGRTALGTAADVGATLMSGFGQIPKAVTGLADIVSGGAAGRAVEKVLPAGFGEEYWSSKLSPAQQYAEQQVGQAKGFLPTVQAALQHPSVIGRAALESVPMMAAGGVVGRGLAAIPKVSTVAGAALGEGLLGAGSMAEGIREQSETGTLTPKQAVLSVAAGAGTTLASALGGRLMHELGFVDPDVLLAGATLKKPSSVVKAMAAGGLAEGVFEEMPQEIQETVLTNVALGKDPMEGVSEGAAMAMLTGATMGAAPGAAGGFLGKEAGDGGETIAQPQPAEAAPVTEQGFSQQLTEDTGRTFDTIINAINTGQIDPANPEHAEVVGEVRSELSELAKSDDPAVREVIDANPEVMQAMGLAPAVTEEAAAAEVIPEADITAPSTDPVAPPSEITRPAVEGAEQPVAAPVTQAQPAAATPETDLQLRRAQALPEELRTDQERELVTQGTAQEQQSIELQRAQALPPELRTAAETSLVDATATAKPEAVKKQLPRETEAQQKSAAMKEVRRQAEVTASEHPAHTGMTQAIKEGGINIDRAKREGWDVDTMKDIRRPGLFSKDATMGPDEMAQALGYESESRMREEWHRAPTKKELKTEAIEKGTEGYEALDKTVRSLTEEGFELGSEESVSAGSLSPGDEVVVLNKYGVPDKLTHQGFDAKGNSILKDGATMTVDPFEQIEILAKKTGDPEVSKRVTALVSEFQEIDSPAKIQEILSELPGTVKSDKALEPYHKMIEGALQRRLEAIGPKVKKETRREAAKRPPPASAPSEKIKSIAKDVDFILKNNPEMSPEKALGIMEAEDGLKITAQEKDAVVKLTGKPIGKPTEKAPAKGKTVAEKIDDAYYRLAGGKWNSRVHLKDLRAAIPELSKRELDDLILNLEDDRKLVLYDLDDPAEITAGDAKSAIEVAPGIVRHIVYMKGPAAATVAKEPLTRYLGEEEGVTAKTESKRRKIAEAKEFQEKRRDPKKQKLLTEQRDYGKRLPKNTEKLMDITAKRYIEFNDANASVEENKKHLERLFDKAGVGSITVEVDGTEYTVRMPKPGKEQTIMNRAGRDALDDLKQRYKDSGLLAYDYDKGGTLKVQPSVARKSRAKAYGPKTLDVAAVEHVMFQRDLANARYRKDAAHKRIKEQVVSKLDEQGFDHVWANPAKDAVFWVERKAAKKEFASVEAEESYHEERAATTRREDLIKKKERKLGTAGVSEAQALGLKRGEKAKLQARAEAQLDESLKFSEEVGESVPQLRVGALSKSQQPAAAIVRSWLSGISESAKNNINIGIISIEDLRAGKGNIPAFLKDELARNPEAIKRKGVKGFVTQKGMNNVIVIPDMSGVSRRSALKILTTLSHEVGHIIKRDFFDAAPIETQNAIIEAHAAWAKKTKQKTSKGRAARRERKPLSEIFDIGTSKFTFDPSKKTPTGQYYEEYLLSFDEWFADQTAKALTTDEKAIGVVEKFFAEVAGMFRVLAKAISGGSKFLPDKNVADFVLGRNIALPNDQIKRAVSEKVETHEGVKFSIESETGSDEYLQWNSPLSEHKNKQVKTAVVKLKKHPELKHLWFNATHKRGVDRVVQEIARDDIENWAGDFEEEGAVPYQVIPVTEWREILEGEFPVGEKALDVAAKYAEQLYAKKVESIEGLVENKKEPSKEALAKHGSSTLIGIYESKNRDLAKEMVSLARNEKMSIADAPAQEEITPKDLYNHIKDYEIDFGGTPIPAENIEWARGDKNKLRSAIRHGKDPLMAKNVKEYGLGKAFDLARMRNMFKALGVKGVLQPSKKPVQSVRVNKIVKDVQFITGNNPGMSPENALGILISEDGLEVTDKERTDVMKLIGKDGEVSEIKFSYTPEAQQERQNTTTLNATKDGQTSRSSAEAGRKSINAIMETLRKVAGKTEAELSKSRLNEQKQLDIYRALRDDPASTVADKINFLTDFSKQADIPVETKAKVATWIKGITQAKQPETQQKRLNLALEKLESDISRRFKSKIRQQIKRAAGPSREGAIKRGRYWHEQEKDLAGIREAVYMSEDKVEQSIEDAESRLGRLYDRLKLADADQHVKLKGLINDTKVNLHHLNAFGSLNNKTLDQLLAAKYEAQEIQKLGRVKIRAVQEAWADQISGTVEWLAKEITGQEKPRAETAAEKARRKAKEKRITSKIKRTAGAVENSVLAGESLFDKVAFNAFDIDKETGQKKIKKTLQSRTVEYFGSLIHDAHRSADEMNLEAVDKIRKNGMRIFNAKSHKELTKKLQKAGKGKLEINTYSKNGKQVDTIKMSLSQAAYWYAVHKEAGSDKVFNKMGVTEKSFKEITGALPDELKAWADYMHGAVLAEANAKENEAYRSVNGVDRKGNGLLNDAMEEVQILNLNDAVLNRVFDLNHYSAWAMPSKILNDTFDDKSIRGYIEQYVSPSTLKALDRYLRDTVKSQKELRGDIPILDKLRSNVVMSMIGANPTTFFKQLTSFPAYAADIPPSAFVKNFAHGLANPRKVIEVMNSSVMAKTRFGDGYERDIREASKETAEQRIGKAFRMRDALMVMTKVGDRVAIFAGYTVYKYHYDKARSGPNRKSHEEAKKIGIRKFEMATESTQQSGAPKDMSSSQMAGSLAKAFTMYMTSPQQYARQTSIALRHMKTDPLNASKRLFIFNVMMPMMFQAVASGFLGAGGEDDDEWVDFWQKELRAVALGPFMGIPIARDIASGIWESANGNWYGKDVQYSPMTEVGKSLTSSIFYLFKGIRDDEELYKRAASEFYDFLSYMVGNPSKPFDRIVEGWADLRSGETEHPFLAASGYSRSARKEKYLGD